MPEFSVEDPFSVSTEDGSLLCAAPIYLANVGTLFGGQTKTGGIPTAVVPAGSPSVVSLAIKTPNGKAATIGDASSYCGTAEIEARIGESIRRLGAETNGAVVDDGDRLLVAMTEDSYTTSGVYDVEGRILDGAGNLVAIARGYVYVEPSLWSSNNVGIPRIDEVRSAIRDFPASNKLLGDYEFSESEIAAAVVRTISKFNGAPPRLSYGAYTTNWPLAYTGPLLDGILAELFEVAAAYNRKGHLPYSAGGVSIDDMAKEKDYLTAAQIYNQRWQFWVSTIKTEINAMSAFCTIGSAYY